MLEQTDFQFLNNKSGGKPQMHILPKFSCDFNVFEYVSSG